MTVEYNILFFKKYVVLPDTTNRIETSWRSIALFLFLFELFFLVNIYLIICSLNWPLCVRACVA